MNMSGIKIGTIRGIPIRIHFTFLLVLPLLAFLFSRVFSDAARIAEVPPEQLAHPWVWGFGIAIGLFVSVLLHELAHSLYALRKGGKVKDITLMMIGGVSQISEMPREAKHEAMMAFVGPLLSIVLGVVLYATHIGLTGTDSFQLRFGLFYLGALNLFLGFFNLLPAFPMDGGRILRALLSRRLGMVKATNVSARVGKTFAVVFGLWGLVSFNLFLLLIAVFVYVGAESERNAVLVRNVIGDLRVRDLMTPYAFAVPAEMSVYEAAEHMLRDRRLIVAAVEDGRPLGLVTLEGVQRVPTEQRAQKKVRDIAVTPAPAVSPDDAVTTALRVMGELNTPQLAVTLDGSIIGSIGRDEIMRGIRLGELRASQPEHIPHDWLEQPPSAMPPYTPPRGTWSRGEGRGGDMRR
jgi:Zn-dependent protease